jgi:hypothetical protein
MSTKPPNTMIGFRLDEAAAEVLTARAELLGVSPHELARHYVVEALQLGEHLAAIDQGLEALHERAQSLQEDLALGIEALLASAGQVTEKQAREWVKTSLNQT